MFNFRGGDAVHNKTESAGTRIQFLIGGKSGYFTYLTYLRNACQTTAHAIKALKGASYAKAASALAAAGTSLVVNVALTDGGGNAVAANDLLAIQLDDGTWHKTSVSSWTAGTLTAVINDAIPAGRSVPKGARVVCYGVSGDAYQNQTLDPSTPTSATTSYPTGDQPAILAKSNRRHEPILIDVNNATAASTVEAASVGYSRD